MRTVHRRPPLPPGPYLVVGLARSGRAAALALRARGEEVRAATPAPSTPDARARARGGRRRRARAEPTAWSCWTAPRTVVKSPGVPQEAPVVAAARERGMPVLGELELGWRLLPNPT